MQYVFKYAKGYTREGRIVYRPVAELQLQAVTKQWHRFLPLVDSGADISLFRRGDAALLGLRLKKGEYHPVMGVGNVHVPSYVHAVAARIGDTGIRAHIAFADSDDVPRLLGRRDIFRNFTVTFDDAQLQVIFETRRTRGQLSFSQVFGVDRGRLTPFREEDRGEDRDC